MSATFCELIQFYIKRRNLPVEQLSSLANLSRKTLYRWVNFALLRAWDSRRAFDADWRHV